MVGDSPQRWATGERANNPSAIGSLAYPVLDALGLCIGAVCCTVETPLQGHDSVLRADAVWTTEINVRRLWRHGGTGEQ